MQNAFGAGIMWGTPLTDAYGNALTNQAPLIFGTLQDVSVDISADVKELYGQLQFPQTVGRGKAKIQCKAKTAQIYGAIFNSLFFGQTLNDGAFTMQYDTVGATISGTPYIIAPQPAGNGTWDHDLGVISGITGVPMKKVAAGPTTGQYSLTGAAIGATCSYATNVMTCTVIPTNGTFQVGQSVVSAGVAAGTYITSLGTGTGGLGTYNLSTSPGTISAQATAAGVGYLFAAADTGKLMYVNYAYVNPSVTASKNSVVNNVPMGYAPTFQCDLMMPYNGKTTVLTLYACVATKLAFATKLDDFMIPEVDFAAFANAGGQVLKWGTTD